MKFIHEPFNCRHTRQLVDSQIYSNKQQQKPDTKNDDDYMHDQEDDSIGTMRLRTDFSDATPLRL